MNADEDLNRDVEYELKRDPDKYRGCYLLATSLNELITGVPVGKSECARRHTGISMKHVGEMLLSLKSRACANVNQRNGLHAQHRPRKFHSFECHVQMGRASCRRFENACKL
jgi:hypothetical protein